MAMLDRMIVSVEQKIFRRRALSILNDHRAWIRFDVNTQVWQYFEIDSKSPARFTWNIGTFDDFNALLLISDFSARHEYAKEYCKVGTLVHGEAI